MQLWQGSLGHRTMCSRVAHVFGNGLTIIYRAGREHQMVVAAANLHSGGFAPLHRSSNNLIGMDAEDRPTAQAVASINNTSGRQTSSNITEQFDATIRQEFPGMLVVVKPSLP